MEMGFWCGRSEEVRDRLTSSVRGKRSAGLYVHHCVCLSAAEERDHGTTDIRPCRRAGGQEGAPEAIGYFTSERNNVMTPTASGSRSQTADVSPS